MSVLHDINYARANQFTLDIYWEYFLRTKCHYFLLIKPIIWSRLTSPAGKEDPSPAVLAVAGGLYPGWAPKDTASFEFIEMFPFLDSIIPPSNSLYLSLALIEGAVGVPAKV